MLLMLMNERIDWPRFVALTATHDVRPAIYYGLSFFERLGHRLDDREVLAAVDPRLGSRARDYGWQYSKLFGEIDQLSLP